MALIQWGPSLEVGIEIIDVQHRRLVDLMNELNEAMTQERGGESMGGILKGLVDYTHTHFRTEENLLERYDYDELDLHRREHRIFTDQIEIYQDRFTAGFMNMSNDVMEYMRGWLLTHITCSDRGYISTLKNAGVQ